MIESALAGLFLRLAAAVAPRPALEVSDWADANRILSSKASSEAGQYKTARTPHLAEIMNCLSAHSPVQRITVKKPAQGGVTELALNWIGYVMTESPASMLVVVPTLDLRRRWVLQRLNPMLEVTPVLAAIFNARSTRDGGNSEDLKDFPGGLVIIGGANSPASLSSMPIRFVICDEVDRFPWEVGQEGDPLALIDQRTKAFPRRKVLLISTPTVSGHSRISLEYAQSDQSRLHLACPHCNRYQELKWFREEQVLSLEESLSTGRIWYPCPHCGAEIEEHHKPAMLAARRWVAKFPERSSSHRGFHWNALATPIGLGHTWRELLDKWKAAQDDTSKLRAFYNTELGEEFREEGDSVDHAALIARVENAALRPRNLVLLRIAGTDVQKNRIEFTVYDFEPETQEAWAIEHVIVSGDTAAPEVWKELEEEFDRCGVQLAGIDAGYNTQNVVNFVGPRNWCMALKGVEGMNRPLIEDERKRKQRLRVRRRKGAPVEPIGVDAGKAMLYARLRKQEHGPGFIHYPDHPSFDAEFFAQLTAERLVTERKAGRPLHKWVKDRHRNEALDCANYALATLHLRLVLRARTITADALMADGSEAPVSAAADVPQGTPFRGFRR